MLIACLTGTALENQGCFSRKLSNCKTKSTHHTHDVAENGTRGSDQSSDDGHEVVVEHEAFGAEGPTGVAVQDGDDDGHVSASDGHSQGNLSLKVTEAVRRGPESNLVKMYRVTIFNGTAKLPSANASTGWVRSRFLCCRLTRKHLRLLCSQKLMGQSLISYSFAKTQLINRNTFSNLYFKTQVSKFIA